MPRSVVMSTLGITAGLARQRGRRRDGTGKQSGRQDLNLRPPHPQYGALPSCATPRVDVSHDFVAGYGSGCCTPFRTPSPVPHSVPLFEGVQPGAGRAGHCSRGARGYKGGTASAGRRRHRLAVGLAPPIILRPPLDRRRTRPRVPPINSLPEVPAGPRGRRVSLGPAHRLNRRSNSRSSPSGDVSACSPRRTSWASLTIT